MIHLHDLGGLWRRTLIAWPDGRGDRETEVFWLQGPSFYADLRIRPGRPARADARGLRDLNMAMLRFMATQNGFFGPFTVADSNWPRIFDFQSDNGLGDRGALVFEGDILVERGIDAPYLEHRARADAGEAMALVLATGQGTPGCLVAVGDTFIYARGHANALPRGTGLARLVAAASLQAAQDLFDCEMKERLARAEKAPA